MTSASVDATGHKQPLLMFGIGNLESLDGRLYRGIFIRRFDRAEVFASRTQADDFPLELFLTHSHSPLQALEFIAGRPPSQLPPF